MDKESFNLSKWYLDFVSDDGIAWIGYFGHLKWKILDIYYSETNYFLNKRRSNFSILNKISPVINENIITWQPDHFKFSGIWERKSEPISANIIESDQGFIKWICFQPSSRVTLSMEKGNKITGRGYVEKIEMNIKPWELHFNQLIWGRFHSINNTIVWIDIQGSLAKSYTFKNGVLLSDAEISDGGIKSNNARVELNFTDKKILRNGPISKNSLLNIPGLKKILPVKIFKTQECKFLSKAVLISENEEIGYAIHEVVRFL